MAIYLGDTKNTPAVRAAMKINYAVSKIINPLLQKQYPNTTYKLKHVIGIDSSEIFVSQIGVKNDNDLVWVGRAANYAAKLAAINDKFSIYITSSVYDNMLDVAKYSSTDKTLMWTNTGKKQGSLIVYGSSWTWALG